MSRLKLINSFWDYFIKNSIELVADKKINWSVWQALNSYLQKIHPLLKIELTFAEDKNSNPTLTISADGFKEAIPTVQKIYDSKPQINN